jgi:L-rhamnose isomerase
MQDSSVRQAYKFAKERYASLGVNTDKAIQTVAETPISLHCWQGDDVGGFETEGAELSGGGIQVTGNYPGKARNVDELRSDIEKVLSFIPGTHRINLHASYLENGGRFIERNEIEPTHFQGWIDWAKNHGLGLDFNPTYFSHPNAADGFTLAHPDAGIRRFWIEHGIACRRIAAEMGRQLGKAAVTNQWIPDGFKDIPVDRGAPRARLLESLDQIFAERIDPTLQVDAIEPKLFGIGAESYTAGSFEFYLGYAASRRVVLTLDSGHFHPTESVADKISAVLLFCPGVLLHISRPVRWDSDHVVILDDEVQSIAREIPRNPNANIYVGLDYFDATINRVASWVIGMRNVAKALLISFLENTDELRRVERQMDFTGRLALLEEQRSLPWGAVWDFYCLNNDVPVGRAWLEDVREYERTVLSNRTGKGKTAKPQPASA